jgi:nucleoside-diphosphate-sugar epimerase
MIVVAGSTGNLGFRIAKALVQEGVAVRALVRAESSKDTIADLNKLDAEVHVLAAWDLKGLTAACRGATCVVSAVAGLRDVIIDAQTLLLDAAVAAKVPRFIPSDYSLNFLKFPHGTNRNLDLRREFHTYLDHQPISATSVFMGAFMDMLTNEMPVILFKQKMVMYWGKADHKWGFTTIDNTAQYTAKVALDDAAPRVLNIAGALQTPQEIRTIVQEVFGEKYKLFCPGGSGLLGFIIRAAKTLSPSPNDLYPAWQGMQYMHNMIDDRSTMKALDNDRYAGMRWTGIRELLSAYKQQQA